MSKLNIFMMLFWSFVFPGIPFKKIFTGLACIFILISGMIAVNNYNEKVIGSTAMFANDMVSEDD